MISTRVRIQLLVFGVITVLTLTYGAVRLFRIGDVLHPPYEVSVVVASSGGLYPRADVDLLGTRVGSVRELRPGPGSGTTVVMAIDQDVVLPVGTHATVGSKSAIGEGYVELAPPRGYTSGSDVAALGDGDTIPIGDTTSPPDLAGLLGNLDALASSVPTKDLATLLEEGSAAVDGIAPSVGRIIRDSGDLSRQGLADLDSLTALIRDARTVLGTQVALGPQTRAYLHELAGLTTELRDLDTTFSGLYEHGLVAGTQVTDLLRDNQEALPVLLANLLSLTTVAADRIPELRKTLVVFPWVLQNSATTPRYCDEYDIETGRPVERTCHYDDDGKPIYTLHLAQQLDQNGYSPCTKGYESTKRYLPTGEPASGDGPPEGVDAEPNLRAGCTSKPSDPMMPNVRGAQNVTTPAWRRHGAGLAAYDPSSGVLVTPDAGTYRISGVHAPTPPTGDDGLGWLLVQAVSPGAGR